MWKYIKYFIGGIALEAIYLLFNYLRKKKSLRNDDEVVDVVWTNELTQDCMSNHYKNGYSLSPKNGHDDNVLNCSNPFCSRANIGRVIRYIDNAQHSIDLAMYTFTSMAMSNALSRALNRNVIVRIITDKEMAFSTGSQVTTLTKLGAPVRFPLSTSLMHHKFCVIDGVKRVSRIMANDKKECNVKKVKSLLLNGSLNWTSHGFNGNWENILITSNKALIKKFEEEFERMWIAFGMENQQKI